MPNPIVLIWLYMPDKEEKNKGGRPLKFSAVVELKQKIQDYFDGCDPHARTQRVQVATNKEGKAIYDDREVMTEQEPYTIMGLARALKTTRDTLLDYERGDYDAKADVDADGERFSDAIKAAKARVNEDVERRLMTGQATTGAIFWLKNNAGWKDKQEHELTSPDGLFGAAALTVKVVDGRDNTQS